MSRDHVTLRGTDAARAALGKGVQANPGAPLTPEMMDALRENLGAAKYLLKQSAKGLNTQGHPISREQAARVAQVAQRRIDEIQDVLQSGRQAGKN
jgi:hypothetical protein